MCFGHWFLTDLSQRNDWLQGMMKTETGRKLAKQRHAFMESYLQQFMLEWDAEA